MSEIDQPGRAVCVRCGHVRGDWRAACPSCGQGVDGDGLLVAWLLSNRNLPEVELPRVSQRIRDGESVRPSDEMLAKARKALGRTFDSDPGLSGGARAALLLTGLILTPLPAWMCWVWWLESRPRAAWQAFSVGLPGAILFGGFGVYLWLLSAIRGDGLG